MQARAAPALTERSIMLFFVDLIHTPEFKRKFSSLRLYLKDFLMCIGKGAVFTARKIMSKIKMMVSVWMPELEESYYLTSDRLDLCVIRTEQA